MNARDDFSTRFARAIKAWIGNRNNSSACTLSTDKLDGRRVERCWGNQRFRTRTKSRPPGRVLRIFDDEDMSQVPLLSPNAQMPNNNNHPTDLVILEVGPPGDTWRYSIERDRFAAKSEWFRAMLLGGLAPPHSDPPPTLPLRHVDKRAFDHLLKYLRGESPSFHSVSTARSTLDVAHQLLCPELARLAIDYIIPNLSSSTVLAVYRGLDLYVPDRTPLITDERTPTTPSAPPLPGDDIGDIAIACSRLLAACHKVIDGAPDDVLRQENFEELGAHEVAELASRDELRLVREGVLFEALDKWAAAECRRLGLEPTASNKRSVLHDDVWYSVRYLLMTSGEFIDGPMRSGILFPEESAIITTRILGNQSGYANNSESQHSTLISRLSTIPRNQTRRAMSPNGGMKPGKKEREDNKRNRRKECATKGQKTCARIGDCIIRVLACVFD